MVDTKVIYFFANVVNASKPIDNYDGIDNVS